MGMSKNEASYKEAKVKEVKNGRLVSEGGGASPQTGRQTGMDGAMLHGCHGQGTPGWPLLFVMSAFVGHG